MADNHIAIDATNTRGGAALRNAVDGLTKNVAALKQILAVMLETNAGTDWTAVEQRFGLPTGKGATAKNTLVNGLAGIDANADIVKLMTWFEGLI